MTEIENHRRESMPDLARYVSLPVLNNANELCHSHQDLEVGELWFHLNANRKSPANLRERFGMLRHCRNTLAHLDPLQPIDIRRLLRGSSRA